MRVALLQGQLHGQMQEKWVRGHLHDGGLCVCEHSQVLFCICCSLFIQYVKTYICSSLLTPVLTANSGHYLSQIGKTHLCYDRGNHDDLGWRYLFDFLVKVVCFGGGSGQSVNLFDVRPEGMCDIPSVEDRSPPSCSRHTLKRSASGLPLSLSHTQFRLPGFFKPQ